MDAHRFDALARAFTERRSRRDLIHVFRGVAFAGPLALVGVVEAKNHGRKSNRRRKRDSGRDRDAHHSADVQAAKKKRKKKKPCPLCQSRLSGKCKPALDGTICPGGSCQQGSCSPFPTPCVPNCQTKTCGEDGCGGFCGSCEADEACQDGTCVFACDTGLTDCGGVCANLQEDTDHCGACSIVCGHGQYCVSGECACCPGGHCAPTDVRSDPRNCGTCNHICSTLHTTPICQDGSCVLETCDAGWADCDGDPETGCETYPLTDADHCGACGVACTGGDVCRDGTCRCLAPTDDLQTAVNLARAGDTIRLCPGTWVLTQRINITKNLTLTGAGTDQSILDGDDTVGVLRIGSRANVTISDLTITKAWFAEDGAGIFNLGRLKLLRTKVIHNTCGYGSWGGGIYNNGGTVELAETSVTDNNHGGGVVNVRGTLTLKAGSSIARNNAQHAGGIRNLNGTVTLEAGSSVTDNISTGSGGGILNSGTLTLQAGSLVARNTAQSGGGISTGGPLTLEAGSSVTANTATSSLSGGVECGGTNAISIADETIVTNNFPKNCAGDPVPATCID